MEKKHQKPKWQEVDGLFGWVQVFAAGITFFCLPSIQRSFSLLYEGLMAKFKRSDTVTSWVPSVNSTVKLCSSPIVGYLVQRFGERVVCFVGAILSCVSLALTAVSPSLEFVFITYGLCVGFGMNCCLVACQTNVSRYFIKKRGRAMGVVFSCLSLGGLALAPLIHFLYQEYNYVGAMLILSAIVSHTCISAVMMRPLPKSAIKDVKKDDDNTETREGLVGKDESDEEIAKVLVDDLEISNKKGNHTRDLGDGDVEVAAKGNGIRDHISEENKLITHTLENDDEENKACNGSKFDEPSERNDMTDKNEIPRNCSDGTQAEIKESQSISSTEIPIESNHASSVMRTDSTDGNSASKGETLNLISEKSSESQTHLKSEVRVDEQIRSDSLNSVSNVSGVSQSLKERTQSMDTGHISESASVRVTRSRCSKIGQFMVDKFRLDLLKNGSFIWICIFMVGWVMCLDVNITFQTTLIKEFGYSDAQAITSLLVYNTIDVPSRLISGLIYDNRILRNYKMELTAVVMFVMSLFQLLYPFVLRHNFILGMVFMAISACSRAIVGSQYVNVVASLTGRENFPNAISINRFCQGIGSFVSAPLGGFLKDTTGSYAFGYIVISIFVLICTIAYVVAKLLEYAKCIKSVKQKENF